MIEFRNQPKGMAYQTKAAPKRGARMAAKSTRKVRLARFARVNIPCQRRRAEPPSVHIFRPMRAKKKPMKCRYCTPIFRAEFRPARAEK